MKKIFFSVLAIAAIAACTKSEVAYDDTPQEIGFTTVAGNITKSVVDGAEFPKTLNMFVFAETNDNGLSESNYINGGEFTYHSQLDGGINVWGGGTDASRKNPYYWPNTKTLHFAGYSKAGTYTKASYDWETNMGTLTIEGYNPGAKTDKGANDLMFFPNTALAKQEGYGKGTTSVPVYMYHTCAWITFIVKGNNVTSGEYTVTGMTMTGIDQSADVTCSATYSDADDKYTPNISWSNNGNGNHAEASFNYSVLVKDNKVVLDETGKNIETGSAYPVAGNAEGNIVVIPQVPGKLNLTYTYDSPAGKPIAETHTELSLSLGTETVKENESTITREKSWEPGKHYIYTVTIGASEILIAPTPVDWTEDANHDVTVE